ncbi:MAG: sugar transferase [Anaerolineae bacterium]
MGNAVDARSPIARHPPGRAAMNAVAGKPQPLQRPADADASPVASPSTPALTPLQRAAKRSLDLAGASLALLALAPLWAILALLVKRSSPGPALYHSRRVGTYGQPFEMCKFRTMTVDADHHETGLIQQTPDGDLLFCKRPDDDRITPLGRFMRRYSLDELPQLWNVLRGEMSLVGPRPELPALVARYAPWQQARLRVPPGITGWWQITHRDSPSKSVQVADDLYYLAHYTLGLDLRILWRTLGAVLRGDGA